MFKTGAIITATLILCLFIALACLLPSKSTLLALISGVGIALLITAYFAIGITGEKNRLSRGSLWARIFSLSFLAAILPFTIAAVLYTWDTFSLLHWGLLIGLTLTFFFNFLSIPLSLYHKQQETGTVDRPLEHYPPVTVLVPARNEEKVLGRTIESIIEASYPDKEIIVIDDGSDDRTYAIAMKYSNRGVKVFHRPNGGKSAALNYGLRFASGEIIVCVDADSLVSKNAIVELVERFEDPRVGAVAGNIKVLNQVNLLTRCQALEYIISIDLFRRALAVFGQIHVVPGALGAYRRELLINSGFYDRDTLAEDFDITLKTLKSGTTIQTISGALAYTEAPVTLTDFIRQRLRWYRGNFQTMWKHRDAVFNSRYGLLQSLSYPYILLSMLVLPLLSIVVIISAILALLNGMITELGYIFIFFLILQYLLSVLSIQLDEGKMRLTLYSPFFVIGYKHLCDFIMLKSFIDVLFRRQMGWGRAERVGANPS